jgi:membrane peptidoglycan carboxypeptidase
LLGSFQERLQLAGFQTIEQSRFSPALLRLAKWGVGLPYSEPHPAGLLLEGASRDTLFDAAPVDLAFRDYGDIPEPVVKSLLFIENKELDDGSVRRNPVIEWGRFLKGVLTYGATRLGLPIPLEGGSTLAIQLEKYRHSPSGRTGSGAEKLRQMVAASVRVYRRGPDTREERRRIILDYLNTMPLAAVPGYGEVQGLGEGLWAWYGIRLQDAIQNLSPDRPIEERARTFKQVLALLCAVRAPTTYLSRNPEAL